jgi:hypothetical protein
MSGLPFPPPWRCERMRCFNYVDLLLVLLGALLAYWLVPGMTEGPGF